MQIREEAAPFEAAWEKSTPVQAFFNFLKTLIGIGIIALPYATNTIGWFYSILLGFPILFIGVRANILLIEVADDINLDELFFPDVVRLTMGEFWARFIEFSVVLLQVGLCIAYLIFLTDSIMVSLISINVSLDKWMIYISTWTLIIPLSLIKRIHSFHEYSKQGIYFGIASLMLILVDCVLHWLHGEYSFENRMNVQNTFKYVGVALVICEGIVPSLNIRESMHEKHKFKQVCAVAITVAFLVSFIIAFCAVVTYGDTLQPIVIFTIRNPHLQLASIALYSISLVLTYPIQLFPAVQVLQDIVQGRSRKYMSIPKRSGDHEPLEHQEDVIQQEANSENVELLEEDTYFVQEWKIILLRMALMVMLYSVAYFVPNFSHFINLIGSLLLSIVFFIFPAIMHMRHFTRGRKGEQIILYSVLLVAGFASLIFGTYESVVGLLE